MASSFHGYGYSEHYEKEIKDFTPLDWVIMVLFWGPIAGAVVLGFCKLWGPMVVVIGFAICMLDVLVRVVLKKKIKLMLIFDAVGVATMIGGGLVWIGNWSFFFAYVNVLYLFICFVLGGAFTAYAVKKKKKIKSYSLEVEALCEIVDETRIRTFRRNAGVFPETGVYEHADMVLPAFRYLVNGEEYYTESTKFYGEGNYGFEEGASVMLRVNPKDPTEILPKAESAAMEMTMGICWLAIGIFCVLLEGFLIFVGALKFPL